MLPHVPELVKFVVPAMCIDSESLADSADLLNQALKDLVSGEHINSDPSPTDESSARKIRFDNKETIRTIITSFDHADENILISALDWLLMLYTNGSRDFSSLEEDVSHFLLSTLSTVNNEVLDMDLLLIGQIFSRTTDKNLGVFIRRLLRLFSNDRPLLEAKGDMIIRQLCVNLNTDRVYRVLGDQLDNYDDLDFASLMVHNLSSNLMTAPELAEFRRRLKNLESKDGQILFSSLFRCFSHSAIATFSLCLLAQAYEQAANLLSIFADFEITVALLVQIDRLVHLLESPIFTYLRLQLLEPDRFPHLYKCLFGLLMILPQSAAFTTLHNRLNAVSPLAFLHSTRNGSFSDSSTNSKSKNSSLATKIRDDGSNIDWNELLDKFRKTQLKTIKQSSSGLRHSALSAESSGGNIDGTVQRLSEGHNANGRTYSGNKLSPSAKAVSPQVTKPTKPRRPLHHIGLRKSAS